MLKLPSAGKIGLAFKCAGSVVLPHVRDEAGPEAEKGKEKHAILEKFRSPPSDFSPEDIELCNRAAKTVGPATAEWVERGIALNPDGRVCLWNSSEPRADSVLDASGRSIDPSLDLGVSEPRGEHGPGDLVADGVADGGGVSVVGEESVDRSNWFVAVADLIQWRGGSSFAVFDWKSSSWVTDPEYNWQLLLPAIWLYLSADRPADFSCELGIVYIGKPTDDGAFDRTKPFVVGAADCEKNLRSMGYLKRKLGGSSAGDVTLYEGKHCQYCPARHRCPAKIGAIARAMVAIGLGDQTTDIGLIKAYQTLIDSKPQLDKAAKNILRENGGEMDLGDGRVAVLTKSETTKKEKIYTRKSKNAKESPDRSDVAEAGEYDTTRE